MRRTVAFRRRPERMRRNGAMRLSGILSMIVALHLVACTSGREFGKPSPETVTLGKTTRADVLAAYGPPRTQSIAVISNPRERAETSGPATPSDGSAAQIVTLVYTYVDRTQAMLIGGFPEVKRVSFDFWNEKLIAYTFTSNRPSETNFDERKVAALQTGKTTKEDVVQMFGTPVGRAIFPAVRNVTDEKYLYFYFQVARFDGARKAKGLEIMFDGAGKVRDYKFGSDFSPAPILPPGTPSDEAEPQALPRT
jgi:hypothetical protein